MQTVNIQVDSETITDQKPNLEIAQDTSIA